MVNRLSYDMCIYIAGATGPVDLLARSYIIRIRVSYLTGPLSPLGQIQPDQYKFGGADHVYDT